MQFMPQPLQLKAKAATAHKEQTTIAVHVQTRNRDCTLIGGEDPDNRFLSSHKKENRRGEGKRNFATFDSSEKGQT